MIHSDNINLDAIVDGKRELYRNELVALFRSCAITLLLQLKAILLQKLKTS